MSTVMPDLRLKSSRFRSEREEDWRRLERLLERAERESLKSLRQEEIVSLSVLYRSTLSSLSVARATSLDRALVDYLESLSTRAYFFVYGARTTLLERVGRFFAHDWPAAVRALWRESLISLAITVLATVIGFVLVEQDPDWFSAFIPSGMASGRDPSATADFLRHTLYDKPTTAESLSIFATYLFNHNATIAILAFALGFAFGLPTVFLLIQNGCSLGALLAVYVNKGLGVGIVGWLFVHGVTELSAIILAGAAGLKIGWTIAFPGQRTRVEAAGAAGRQAALVMCGVVLMLVVAGILESFARSLVNFDWGRYAIAGTTLLIWAGYFYFPRGLFRRRHG